MARNEEKNFARLNRFLLQQQQEENLKKKPHRPLLSTLNQVEEVKHWLPSIIADLDFHLKQCEVACLPERRIRDHQVAVDRLEREYRAFVRKLKQLDPDCDVIPWTNRAYAKKSNKRTVHQPGNVDVAISSFDPPADQASASNSGPVNSDDLTTNEPHATIYDDANLTSSDTHVASAQCIMSASPNVASLPCVSSAITASDKVPRISADCSTNTDTFQPLDLPVLEGDTESQYEEESTKPAVTWPDLPSASMDSPLQFNKVLMPWTYHKRLKHNNAVLETSGDPENGSVSSTTSHQRALQVACEGETAHAGQASIETKTNCLGLDYSSSSEDND